MPMLRPLARIWTSLLGSTALLLLLGLSVRLMLPYLNWSPQPILVTSDPPAGAEDVLPGATITLTFSTPMNRASVEAALRIDPPISGRFFWSSDATLLNFSPDGALEPAVTYTVSLDASALGRWWQPLANPQRLQFTTAAQPSVVTVLPTGSGVPIDGRLAILFSQPMVEATMVGRQVSLPELRSTPPFAVRTSWLDPQTLLITPQLPLAPATRYTMTLDAELRDLLGIELGSRVQWSFTTAWPALLEYAPADQARWVSPKEPLRLRLAAPLDQELLRRILRITPPIAGELQSELDGNTQLVRFTPRDGWAYGVRYSVELVAPPGSDLGTPPEERWHFRVEPRPRLVAFFPGQDQILAPNEPIRLVFSTPMEEATLRRSLRLEPPTDDLAISVTETEVRLQPSLRPSTIYTITLPAELRDRAGEALGREVSMQLRTAPARPTLATPDALGHLLNLPFGGPISVTLETINLSQLDLSLYRLDQGTLLRTLELRADAWLDFEPERYSQPLVRQWQVTASSVRDVAERLELPITLDATTPLTPGAYYLRIVTAEGPRADLVLLVSTARLALRRSEQQLLLWATDLRGTPLSGLNVALYRTGMLIERGQTDSSGLWAPAFEAKGDTTPLLALIEGDGFALVRSDWLITTPTATVPRTYALLFPNRTVYTPGERVELRGFARERLPDGRLGWSGSRTTCRLQLRSSGVTLGTAVACRIDATNGLISGEFPLATRLDPGSYTLLAQIGDAESSLALRITAPGPSAITLSDLSTTGSELSFQLSRNDLPAPATTISWSLQLEPLSAPQLPEGFTKRAMPTVKPVTLHGVGASDPTGRFSIALPEASQHAFTYHLWVSSSDGSAVASGLLGVDTPHVALRLPRRLVASDQRSTVDLLIQDSLGRPIANQALSLDLYRAGSTGQPLVSRRARSDAEGRAQVELVQLNPGVYELVATAGGPTTRTELWVYGGRFERWPAEPGALELIVERDRYSPGDVATLLVAAPAATGSLLLSIEGRGTLLNQVESFELGQLIRIPISSDMAPGVLVTALFADAEGYRTGSVTLHVHQPEEPLSLTLQSAAAELLPAAGTTLTMTSSISGSALATDLLVVLTPVAPTETAAPVALPSSLAPQSRSVAALPLPGGKPAAPAPPPPVMLQPPGIYRIVTNTGTDGMSVSTLTMPEEPGVWRVDAYAFAPQLITATSIITSNQPISYRLIAPTSLNHGDQAELSLQLRNTGTLTHEISVRAFALGLDLSAPDAQRLALPPATDTRLVWKVTPRVGAASARLLLLISGDGVNERVSRDVSLNSWIPTSLEGRTVVGSGIQSLPVAPAATSRADVTIALAPNPRAALADQAATLASLPNPSTEEIAALTIVAARLAERAGAEERAEWAALARRGIETLAATQAQDGGWGWWPATASHPFVSAFALEAAAVATAILERPAPINVRADAYLDRVAAAAEPDLQAYIAYVRMRAGSTSGVSSKLVAADLEADGLAFLTMSLPPIEAAPLQTRLLSRSELGPTDGTTVAPLVWRSERASSMPRNSTILSASAIQALRTLQNGPSMLAESERTILAAWRSTGWSTAYEAARIALALPLDPLVPGGGPSALWLNDQPLIEGERPITTTVRIKLPADAVLPDALLRVTSQGATPFLITYSRPTAPLTATTSLAINQELIDVTTGAALDPNQLQPGQLVGLRLTIVVAQALPRAELRLWLPAGFEVAPLQIQAPIQRFTLVGNAMLLDLTPTTPGVYSQVIPLRVGTSGRFSAPAAELRNPYHSGTAVAPSGIAVTVGE